MTFRTTYLRYDTITYYSPPTHYLMLRLYLLNHFPWAIRIYFLLYFDLRAPSTLYLTWVLPPLHSSITLCYICPFLNICWIRVARMLDCDVRYQAFPNNHTDVTLLLQRML